MFPINRPPAARRSASRCKRCRTGWVRPSDTRRGTCWPCQDRAAIEVEVAEMLDRAVADSEYQRAMQTLTGSRQPAARAVRTMPVMEQRTVPFALRSTGDGRTLSGYAAVFNSPTKIRDVAGEFDETILPGAFKRSLAERTPILQWDHGKDPRIGTAPIGNVTVVREDDRGLFVEARLYDHPDVERVRLAIAGGAVKGMSFRFGVPDGGDTWTRRTGKPDLREVRDADVHELGPVAFPAYVGTSVAVRAA